MKLYGYTDVILCDYGCVAGAVSFKNSTVVTLPPRSRYRLRALVRGSNSRELLRVVDIGHSTYTEFVLTYDTLTRALKDFTQTIR